MINQIGQVMLYVNDQDQAVQFWTEKVGFVVVSEDNNGQGMKWIEIAPAQGAQTSFVLHNKQLIAQMQPELNLGTPSIMLFSDNLDGLYEAFKDKGITVGELVTMPTGRLFNFADSENNYFAVMEKK
ncbi:VOC family protein [Paenibacillus alvei]|uniref:VOC family protein n=1 Tax=Paenibacillus alvei TaxID=44250 RepID=A0ABT4GTN6_PAEAL|nr:MULTISPECIES: VOC family protein [Paenibacillus]MCY7483199.1 VOC family protein [Paenibacillus alvei]MCY9543142.1 VOC family protein [Paenibacillus alvei]MCY9707239.1 VOC family protein [Paenibacillus alvei]MCY9733663.1 VOC family protein [Paenibacillus alvei]MCY9755433.1 VOC family protein [Paenibacillus alvei]